MKKIMSTVTFLFNLMILISISLVSLASAGGWEVKKVEKAESIECLALNIYWETRAVSMADAVAITDVVYNRVESRHFPNTICKVIHEGKQYSDGQMKRHQCQFSWYCDGRSDTPKNSEAWERSRKIAHEFFVFGTYRGLTEGSTHYHANYVKPNWAPNMTRVTRVGSHIFYRMKGWNDYEQKESQ